ncbi:MAG: DUF2993 domain-containing protein [Oscillatoriales cyanobacterium C42_A2020_001]|nr:DUF2993 domain-containing protein [Leptolyngbyaceae cyanobacterium C42_A2020_001]
MNGEPGLGEQALSKIAEVGITSQLDEVEELNIDIRTDPIKAIQGEVDSVAIEGKGMVIQQDLRMEKIEVKTDTVSIDPLSVVFGNIELTQPTNADARILLKATDLNRALSSDYLRPKLKNLKLQVQEKLITIDIQQVELSLPGEGKLSMCAEFLVRETGEVKQVSAIVVPQLKKNQQQISLEILSFEGHGVTHELANTLIEQLMKLLDLKNFDVPGMSLQLKEFEVEKDQLVLHATTKIDQIPSS